MSTEAPGRAEVAAWIRRLRMPPLRKLVLLTIFEYAGLDEDDRWHAFPKTRTIAEDACIESIATVRKHLAALEADGLIEREARVRRDGAQTSNRIVLLYPRSADGEGPAGAAATPPLPGERGTTLKDQGNSSGADAPSSGSAPARRDEAPEGFPDELRPHARAAYVVLRDVAARRNAKAINARALASTIMARPRKPIVKAAHDVSAWIDDHPATPCRDVLARYRRWLDREEDLASIERLPGEGPATLPGNVTPLRRGSAEDARQARQARRLDAARREGLIE